MWRVSVGLDGNVGQTRAPGRAGVAVDGSMDDTSLLSLTVEIQSDGCGCVDAAELRAQLITRQDSAGGPNAATLSSRTVALGCQRRRSESASHAADGG
jgi:hypothetical protein